MVLAVVLVGGLVLPGHTPKDRRSTDRNGYCRGRKRPHHPNVHNGRGLSGSGLGHRRASFGSTPRKHQGYDCIVPHTRFVILSMYLFTTVAEDKGGTTSTFEGLTAGQVKTLGFNVEDIKRNANGTFDGKIRHGLPTEGRLVTILGTSAAAVSAFYFGTTSVAAARAFVPPREIPSITRIDPQEGSRTNRLNLRSAAAICSCRALCASLEVRSRFLAVDVLANSSEIRCKSFG